MRMSDVKLYVKKPIPVKAYQWNGVFEVGSPVQPLKDHWHHGGGNKELSNPCKHCGISYAKHGWIEALTSGHIICPGDFIVNVDHKIRYMFPLKPDIFYETYQEVKS